MRVERRWAVLEVATTQSTEPRVYGRKNVVLDAPVFVVCCPRIADPAGRVTRSGCAGCCPSITLLIASA
jgi:hypothetical protein